MTKVIKVKGLDQLSKKLKNINRKLKKYDGTHTVSLPFTQDEWDRMDSYERQIHINQTKNQFINNMMNDVFK